MSDKDRKKKDGQNKNKENQAMRESVAERKEATGDQGDSSTTPEQQGSRGENEGGAAGSTERR